MNLKISREVDIFEEGVTKVNGFVEETTERSTNSIDVIYNGINNPTEIRYKLEPTSPITAIDTQDDSLGFILVPLLVFVGIVVLSALVYLMARNRRRIGHIYCSRKHASAYTTEGFDANLGENNHDIDDPTECLLKGKLQIDRNSYASCRTTDATKIGSSNELFA